MIQFTHGFRALLLGTVLFATSQFCVAEDIELYHLENNDKPRVLLVFDNSLSMALSINSNKQCKGLLGVIKLCPETRLSAAKKAMKKLINDNPDVDFALIKSNGPLNLDLSNILNLGGVLGSAGGYVAHGFGSDHNDIIETIDDWGLLSLVNLSPATEMLHEAMLYLHGQRVGYDHLNLLNLIDLRIQKQGQYISPFELLSDTAVRCESRVNVVLITDGVSLTESLPLLENSRENDIKQLHQSMYGYSAEKFNNTYLPIVAKLLHGQGIDNYDVYPETNERDFVNVHIVGFGRGMPRYAEQVLMETAKQGGGQYFLAESIDELNHAFTATMKTVRKVDASFTSPAIVANGADRTRHLDSIYLTMFKPDLGPRWQGNLKKLQVSGAEIVDATGKAALDDEGKISQNSRTFWLPTSHSNDGSDLQAGGVNYWLSQFTQRAIYTDSAAGLLPFTFSALQGQLDELDELFNESPEQVEATINWARGIDVDDENNNNDRAETRANIFGDPLHSKPVAIDYGNGDVRILIGTNAGFLHMFQDKGGVLSESWAFIPRSLYRILKPLRENQANNKVYGVDGPISLFIDDKNSNGIINEGDRVWAFFGLRRGGRDYYGLDISVPNSPKLLWSHPIQGGSGAFKELGQTWSKPVVTYIKLAGFEDKPVLIFAAGYDTNKDQEYAASDSQGRGVYIVDASTGEKVWSLTPENGFKGVDSIAADVATFDANYDGYIDRLYVADTGGNIWRVDMPDTNYWTHYKLAELSGNRATQKRRFLTQTMVARTSFSRLSRVFYSGKMINVRENTPFDAVLIGSGDRAAATSTNTQDQLYMIRDINTVTGKFPNGLPEPIKINDLMDISSDPFSAKLDDLDGFNLLEMELSSFKGWYYNLPSLGEKSLAAATVVGGVAYFTSYTPAATDTQLQCVNNTGHGAMYAFHLHYGTKVYDQLAYLTHQEIPDTPQLFFGSMDQCVDENNDQLCDDTMEPIIKKSQFLLLGPWLNTTQGGTELQASKAFIPQELLGPELSFDEDGHIKLVNDTQGQAFGFKLQQTYVYRQDIISH
ncbi:MULTISPECIES: pilus assembly protein [Pseudoalteromonas]|uniref:pilus assembly protein n=1 Tax=Pseudoalteromonas TaxID=53246 RepID=UPI00031CDEC6|nr:MULTISPECIES: PilC/PilY family type IV pilus protein [Pseudoalteromonas]MCF6143604.1 type IV pilus assembly protein PilY1 [Pseudoalteromonas mariniglutinosa NCIMB 1770]